MNSIKKLVYTGKKIKKQAKISRREWYKNIYTKKAFMYSTGAFILIVALGVGIYFQYFKAINMDDVESSFQHEGLVMQLGNHNIENGATCDVEVICEPNKSRTMFTIMTWVVNKDILSANNINISFKGMIPTGVFSVGNYSQNVLHIDSMRPHHMYSITLIYAEHPNISTGYTDVICTCDGKSFPFKIRMNLSINKDGTVKAYWERMKSAFRSEIECEMYYNSGSRFLVLSESKIEEPTHSINRESKVFKPRFKDHRLQLAE